MDVFFIYDICEMSVLENTRQLVCLLHLAKRQYSSEREGCHGPKETLSRFHYDPGRRLYSSSLSSFWAMTVRSHRSILGTGQDPRPG
jgi:hypothetical protein